MTSAAPRRYGVASAFIHLNRNTASTVGLAIAVAIAVATMASLGVEPRLDVVTEDGGAGVASAFTAGLRNVYYMSTGLMVLAMVASFLQGKRVQPTEVIEPTKHPVADPLLAEKEATQGTPD